MLANMRTMTAKETKGRTLTRNPFDRWMEQDRLQNARKVARSEMRAISSQKPIRDNGAQSSDRQSRRSIAAKRQRARGGESVLETPQPNPCRSLSIRTRTSEPASLNRRESTE